MKSRESCYTKDGKIKRSFPTKILNDTIFFTKYLKKILLRMCAANHITHLL